jgi:tetratricopeptide (TPR) repeat protein
MNPLDTMLKQMNKSGVSCEITRQNKHGILEPVKEAEIKTLTTKSTIATTASLISRLSTAEKLEWAIETKDEGNDLYQRNEYLAAMEKYVECLTASDFGQKPSEEEVALKSHDKSNNIDELVLPVLCNLAACCIQLQQWQKGVLFCDQALRIKPETIKVLYRQGICFVQTGEYQSAMKNFQLILNIYKNKKDLPDRNGQQLLSPTADRIRSMHLTPLKDSEDDEREEVGEDTSFDGVRNESADQFQSDHQQQLPNRSQSSDDQNNEEERESPSNHGKNGSTQDPPTFTIRSTINQLNEREKKNLLIYMTKAKHGLQKDKKNYQLQKEGLKKAFQSSPRKNPPEETVLLNEDNSESAQAKGSKLKQKILSVCNSVLRYSLLTFLYVLKMILFFLKMILPAKKVEGEKNKNSDSVKTKSENSAKKQN